MNRPLAVVSCSLAIPCLAGFALSASGHALSAMCDAIEYVIGYPTGYVSSALLDPITYSSFGAYLTIGLTAVVAGILSIILVDGSHLLISTLAGVFRGGFQLIDDSSVGNPWNLHRITLFWAPGHYHDYIQETDLNFLLALGLTTAIGACIGRILGAILFDPNKDLFKSPAR